MDILLDFAENSHIGENTYQKYRREYREFIQPIELRRWRYNRAVAYLVKRKQLEVFKKNDKIFLKLTRKGKLRALMHRLENEFKVQLTWDGKWRLAIWDIPEKFRKQRNQIRLFVKDLGFYRLQHSVFITPFPLPRSAVDYLGESGLDRYIRFLRVDQIDNDRWLKKYFGVKTALYTK